MTAARTGTSFIVLLGAVLGEPCGARARQAQPVESEEAAELALAFPARTKVVTATRTPHLIVDSPFSLSSVSRVELEALGALNVPDGLRLVPGLFVMEAGAGDWNLSIRGLARPLDERVLLLVDNRYAGFEAFAAIVWPLVGPPVALVDHVEVLRGAGSPVHGQNALSGVVQVITRTPKDMLGRADQMLEALGRAGSVSGGTVVGAARAPHGSAYRVVADFDHLGEFDQGSQGEMSRFYGGLRWDVPFGEHLNLHVEVGGAQARERFIAFQGGARFDPATNLFGYVEADHRSSRSESTFSLSFNRIEATIRSLDERLLGAAILVNPFDVNPTLPRTPILVFPDFAGDGLVATGGKGPDVLPNPAFGQAISASLDVVAAEAWTTRHLGRHDLTAGATLRYAHADAPLIFPTFDQLVVGAFVQDEWRAGERLRLTLGTRYDLNSEVEQRFSPRGGVLVHVGRNVDLRASTGISFRDPAVFDLQLRVDALQLIVQTPSGPVVIPPGTPAGAAFPGSPANGLQRDMGNSNLRPETMVSGDAGVRARLGPLELDVDVFVESLSDGIRYSPLRRSNAIDIDIVGTETAMWLTLGRRAQLQASYTYQEPVSRNPPDIATGTPSHLAAGAVGVRLGPIVITPSATWRSSIGYDLPPELTLTRPRLAAAGPGFDVLSSEATATVPSRLSLDATVAWPIRPAIEVALVGRNLLGEDVPDFPRFVEGDALGNRFAESPPRLIFGRLRLSH